MKEASTKKMMDYLSMYNLDQYFPGTYKDKLQLFSFTEGEDLFVPGERLDRLYFLVEGKIKIYTLTPEGQSLINRFKKPLAVIGDVEYIKQSAVLNSVEAVSSGEMIGFPYAALKDLEKEHPAILRFLLEMVAHKFYTEAHFTSMHMLYPVEVRLAGYLLSISSVGEGTAFHQEMRTSNLSELAEWIGTSYRHLNRVLRKMEADEVIERSRGSIMIKNLQELRLLAKGNIYE
ncbi:Crp/Fnr family transcriptional regulator [Halobacillus kuroshimensis]|uniref:Crp/Fnr family transcriptional regulator n=1 Tax=Halobacillus kuroshimensis TaxID=302481 RepID=A0ABS3DU93_9BACI|nr:Crp/Fnr family transcriptional regulator [Halobacillus kuroshimensis]MBN8234880.1 Crp/Fnr family transcriptional regulator [Halobacillus kuroshimensis]